MLTCSNTLLPVKGAFSSLLLPVYLEIDERKDGFGQQCEPHNPPTPFGAHVTPVLRDVQVPPDKDSVGKDTADITSNPVLIISCQLKQQKT
jgi:hypothetical protein